jgi:hypothetical protein
MNYFLGAWVFQISGIEAHDLFHARGCAFNNGFRSRRTARSSAGILPGRAVSHRILRN